MPHPEPPARFPLGQIVATPGAVAALARGGVFPEKLLARHCRGDWGVLCVDDQRENERAVAAGTRVLSAYPLPDATILWIITEANRSVTTLLLPSEY